MPKKATLTVEFIVELPDEVDPNEITFDFDIDNNAPMLGEKPTGRILSYCTQEYVGE